MGQVSKWRELGARAARSDKPETDCPYVVGGTAWRYWMEGFKHEHECMAEYLRDMEHLLNTEFK